jgi:hypothetical protein
LASYNVEYSLRRAEVALVGGSTGRKYEVVGLEAGGLIGTAASFLIERRHLWRRQAARGLGRQS